jgi:hypothetical protein
MIRLRSVAFAVLPILAIACAPSQGDAEESEDFEGDEANFSSNQAELLDFKFEGEISTSDQVWDAKQIINDQMLYTIGHLNGDRSVGRLDRLQLTDVQTSNADGKTTIKYKAVLPVAWGSKTNRPSTYTFQLPKDASYNGQSAFTEKYKHNCVDWGAHDVDSGSMWYYYRPARCQIDGADVIKVTASVTVSPENSTGKYPEYDKVWEDGQLNMVAIFGKYEDGKTSGDAGIDAYNRFLSRMRDDLRAFNVVSEPANVAANPGVSVPDVTFTATLPDGKKVSVTALLVDNVRTSDARFNQRYTALSTNADIIAYNGHAGLGQNVRALAQKGSWKAGKYVIMFMNGCDTFAYVDGSLAQTRARVNPDDPSGTKYMEFVTNALPSFFHSMANASSTLFKGLMRYDAPMTYDQIFDGIDDSQVVLVTGEQDNVFRPGVAPQPTWSGIQAEFPLARYADRRFDTGMLQPGKYHFDLSGTGSANLYVKVGRTATSRTFDCKSTRAGAAETCTVTLNQAANVNVLVRGTGESNLKFVAKKL